MEGQLPGRAGHRVRTLRLRDRAEDRTWSSDFLCSAFFIVPLDAHQREDLSPQLILALQLAEPCVHCPFQEPAI